MYFCLSSLHDGFYFQKTDAPGRSSRITWVIGTVHRLSPALSFFFNQHTLGVHPVYDPVAENDP